MDGATEARFTFQNKNLFRSLCGVADQGVRDLADLLQVELIPRGHSFLLRCEDSAGLARALRFFERAAEKYPDGRTFPDPFDNRYLFQMIQNEDKKDSDRDSAGGATDAGESFIAGVPANAPPEHELAEMLKDKVFTTANGRAIMPKTLRQAAFVHSLLENEVTFALGPAGTGKTFLGIVAACRQMMNGDVERIILTRPAVEAGESLGFLPGDLAQKVDPYLRPVYDALYECFGVEKVHDMLGAGKIEIAPIAYMRGRTLRRSFIILDEAQNCTLAQLKMFLTRLGKHSRMCIGGDASQIDLAPGKSGLMSGVNMLREVEGIGVIEFGNEDIIRNRMVERILRAFDAHEKRMRGENHRRRGS